MKHHNPHMKMPRSATPDIPVNHKTSSKHVGSTKQLSAKGLSKNKLLINSTNILFSKLKQSSPLHGKDLASTLFMITPKLSITENQRNELVMSAKRLKSETHSKTASKLLKMTQKMCQLRNLKKGKDPKKKVNMAQTERNKNSLSNGGNWLNNSVTPIKTTSALSQRKITFPFNLYKSSRGSYSKKTKERSKNPKKKNPKTPKPLEYLSGDLVICWLFIY